MSLPTRYSRVPLASGPRLAATLTSSEPKTVSVDSEGRYYFLFAPRPFASAAAPAFAFSFFIRFWLLPRPLPRSGLALGFLSLLFFALGFLTGAGFAGAGAAVFWATGGATTLFSAALNGGER